MHSQWRYVGVFVPLLLEFSVPILIELSPHAFLGSQAKMGIGFSRLHVNAISDPGVHLWLTGGLF